MPWPGSGCSRPTAGVAAVPCAGTCRILGVPLEDHKERVKGSKLVYKPCFGSLCLAAAACTAAATCAYTACVAAALANEHPAGTPNITANISAIR